MNWDLEKNYTKTPNLKKKELELPNINILLSSKFYMLRFSLNCVYIKYKILKHHFKINVFDTCNKQTDRRTDERTSGHCVLST